MDDEILVISAASSLERITGAGLTQWVELSPDAVMESDTTLPPVEEPLAQSMEEENDPEAEASPDVRAFVPDQEEQLAVIRKALESKLWQAGAWSLPVNRTLPSS